MRTRKIAILFLVCALGSCSSSNDFKAGEEDSIQLARQAVFADPGTSVPEVSTEQLAQILQARTATVLDTRPYLEWSISHIPGAINLPFSACLNDDGTWKDKQELRRIWSTVLGDEPNLEWGVMCGSGVTACHLVISAQLAGWREPRLYAGSWSEWIADRERPIASGAS